MYKSYCYHIKFLFYLGFSGCIKTEKSEIDNILINITNIRYIAKIKVKWDVVN